MVWTVAKRHLVTDMLGLILRVEVLNLCAR
jgi:hypothetical protein